MRPVCAEHRLRPDPPGPWGLFTHLHLEITGSERCLSGTCGLLGRPPSPPTPGTSSCHSVRHPAPPRTCSPSSLLPGLTPSGLVSWVKQSKTNSCKIPIQLERGHN